MGGTLRAVICGSRLFNKVSSRSDKNIVVFLPRRKAAPLQAPLRSLLLYQFPQFLQAPLEQLDRLLNRTGRQHIHPG
jgi:hypothetical protein